MLETFGVLFDVLMFTETWYTEQSCTFQLPGYQSFFRHRAEKKGGGIGILVKNHIECEIIDEFTAITADY